MALKKLFKKAKKTVKKVQSKAKESATSKGVDQFFKKEKGKYLPHGCLDGQKVLFKDRK